MGVFFGMIIVIIFIFMWISKVTNISIGYNNKFGHRNETGIINPDDLDKVIHSGRSLIDKKYKKFKEIESEYLSEYNKYDEAYFKLILTMTNEQNYLRKMGINEDIIKMKINEKYMSDAVKLLNKRKKIKKEFEDITGKKLDIKE